MNEKAISEIERKLKFALRRLDEKQKYHEQCGGEMLLTYHGGRAIGYLEGKVAVLEDLLDILKEE
jgi:hypothetical protein